METLFYTYLAYLAISAALTLYVARTLHKNGRIFLVDTFHGNEPLADSVNQLLIVGFYLINIGYVTLALKYGGTADTPTQALETLSTKIGLVLVVQGAIHFVNLFLFIFWRMRNRATESEPSPPQPSSAAPASPE